MCRVPKLVAAWESFDLETDLARALGRPTKVANDADVQGSAVVAGRGLELVLTLGTGVGTAFFHDGHLLPHFEFSHTPFRKGGTYNEQLGEAARRSVGTKKWQRRVLDAVETFRALTFFDWCYIGGGNSQPDHRRSAGQRDPGRQQRRHPRRHQAMGSGRVAGPTARPGSLLDPHQPELLSFRP